MATETTGATGTQADPETQPPAGNPQAQAASGTEQQPESISLDEAKKLRAENHSLRERAKALESEKTAAENAKLPEQERLQRRLAELERSEAEHERERQDWRLRDAVTTSALRLGYRDPADTFALIDRAALEYDEGGNPKNVDKLLTELATAKPYLTGNARGSFDGGPRGKPTGGESFDDQLRRAAGRA